MSKLLAVFGHPCIAVAFISMHGVCVPVLAFCSCFLQVCWPPSELQVSGYVKFAVVLECKLAFILRLLAALG